MKTIHKLCCATLSLLACFAQAQDRLPTMPRYDRYSGLRGDIFSSVKRASIDPTWAEDGKSFWFQQGGRSYQFDIASLKRLELTTTATGPQGSANRQERRNPNGGRPSPERGRQYTYAISPDGKLKAQYKDRNVWLSSVEGSDVKQITTSGSEENRTKCGQASWVYGEELGVREAMWWSPDGKKLAYYKFDDSKVKDYYLATDITQIQDALDTEAYPKAGADNPDVELWIYDLASGQHVQVDSNFGAKEMGTYVYQVRWSPDGNELLFNRTNRKQNTMEFCAANRNSGKCRVIVREQNLAAWTDNSPWIRWMDASPGKPQQFLWKSDRNGFSNFYLGDISGAELRPVTKLKCDTESVERIDQRAGLLYYMARDGDNYYRLQLHRVNLDGSGDVRLTDPKFSHRVDISPNGDYFIDTFETIDTPPSVQLCDARGKVLASLSESDDSKFKELGLQRVERIKFKAADGVTDCFGYLSKPSDFDPSKRYPLLVSCYGGPESGGGRDSFQLPNPITEMGFLVAWFDGRGTSGRGQAFKNAVYGKLGIVEIDDQAAGVKALAKRPYVDGSRVGIYGTSYGGYTSVMAILRHPDVFQAAVACSPVTDWKNYDTIYTERYMGLPWDSDNAKGYEDGSAMKYANKLTGRLLLFYGTADNNVHPANSYQLARALQRARKSFYMMAGPDMGHSAVNQDYQWEFFVDHLVTGK